MSNEKHFEKGDLIITSEGYYALVLFQEGQEFGVLLGNGMATIEDVDSVKECTVKDGLVKANFSVLFTGTAWEVGGSEYASLKNRR